MTFELSAVELYCMAHLNRKRKLCGIVDVFVDVERPRVMDAVREITADFVARGVAEMDMDGNISLRTEYSTLLEWICDCDSFLTVTYCEPDGRMGRRIFWVVGCRLLMAQTTGGKYVITETDADAAAACIKSHFPSTGFAGGGMETVLPAISLKTAAGYCKSGNQHDGFRVLRQNGADEQNAHMILQGLSAKANWLAIRRVNNRKGAESVQKKVCFWTEDRLYSLERRVVGLRTCVAFVPEAGIRCESELTALADAFERDGRRE